MSTQIAVRLPDDLVSFLDESVRAGRGRSRADVVTRALEREQRRERALRDAVLIAEGGGYPELEGIIAYQAAHPLSLD